MAFSPADARFLIDRGLGLIRRGVSSLRSRGWRATWIRARALLLPAPAAARAALLLPPDAPFAPFAISGARLPDAAGITGIADPAAPRAGIVRASIVIPVYGQFPRTLACLRALAAHPPAAAFEVIVVDDGSTDDTADALPQIGGVRYHRRARNGGFIAACNDGAALASGEVLVFLNNDTVPQPGWLDAMLATFDAQPDAGIVGAQLLYPDGRLQESGGVVFADGSAWNYGRFEDADDPRYASLRDADYVSGAALAIPRALFAAVGGFDPRYAPAYYEDTDLAFAVRAAGRRVLVQPAARVVHAEGGTAGTDPSAGVKAAQTRNRDVFAAHRREALARQLPAGTLPTPALLHRHRRNVLIVDSAVPQPDRDSGSMRLVQLMRLLREEGAHVVFVPAERERIEPATAALQRDGVETWYRPYFDGLPAWLREHGPRFDVAMVSRYHLAGECLPLLRKYAPQARCVFDTVDLHFLRERRGAEIAGDRALLRAAERTRALELRAVADADVTLVVSDSERALLHEAMPQARVELLSNLHRVASPGLSFEASRDLLFVGGFAHPPNVDAVRWFVETVFDRIRARHPEIVFHCIGADPPPQIAALAARPGVIVHGHVPDLDPYLDGCRVSVAPLRFGAGVKGKINQSMARGLPVVATTCAVEAMHLQDGVDVLIGDDAESFASAVLRLYDDAALWRRLAINGLDNVQRYFSADAARETVRRVFW
jgi:O-antigen biosynthesis protein